ncbi:hypothetical protein LTR37_016840, partial [Vermiconidia calcicola]
SPASETKPGDCDACRQDPERAQACKKLAESASMTPQDTQMMEAGSRISCSEFMERASRTGQPLAGIADLVGNQVHINPTANGGYEVEEHEAAQVLQTLSTRNVQKSRERSSRHPILQAAKDASGSW